MKIDLSAIDREQFLVNEHIINGESCWLVIPQHIGAKYTKDNLHFRSSLWNSQCELISASFKKFFNWGEQPDLISHPTLLDNCELMEKIDGSTLIVSKYKGQMIIRTRGTSDATKLDNGHEIKILKEKYPSIFTFEEISNSDEKTSDVSFIFEWTTPTNKIVIDYGLEPELTLIGAINHNDYSLWAQNELDYVTKFLSNVKRPKRYSFNTIPEMISAIEVLKNEEGICVYFNNGQDIRKLKGLEYLAKHRFKSNATLPNILELWFSQGKPDYFTFEENLTKSFDFECFKMVEIFCKQVTDSYVDLRLDLIALECDIKPLRSVSRKEAAKIIYSPKYVDKGLTGAGFKMLDNKPVDDKQLKKLMEARLGL